MNPLTDKEIYLLIAIFIFNKQYRRCSGNTLFKYLSGIHRTPSRKDMFSIIRKFKKNNGQAPAMIIELGVGPGKNYLLTEGGKQYLFELERRLRINYI